MLNHKGTKTLETISFTLRPFVSEDAYDMYNNWASDIEVVKFLTWKKHGNISKTNIVVKLWENEYKSDEYYNWAIEEKYSKHVIGSINLMNIDNYNENCEVGFCLGRKYWNKGIMVEVLNKILDFAFNEVDFERVTARRYVNNIASGMILKKCNFVYEGTLRKIIKDNKGVLTDCKYYSILKSEYISINNSQCTINNEGRNS